MTLSRQIERAFDHRGKPERLIEPREPRTPEQEDALSFAARDWRAITWEDWERHPDAFYAFAPEAFIYYLPSILTLTASEPGKWLSSADALIRVLDRSPDVYHWDAFIEKRLVGLEAEEYEAIKAWLLSRSGSGDQSSEDTLARAYETVDLLKKETERLRGLLPHRLR